MKDKALASLRRKPLGREVTDILRRMIIDGGFKPGERLVEERLAERMGISRTPLREALHRLEQEGALVKRPRGGYVLKPLSPDEVEEAVEVRSVLEGLVAARAAKNATAETVAAMEANLEDFRRALAAEDWDELVSLNAAFHTTLRQTAGSALLLRLLGELEGVVERISGASQHGRDAATWTLTEHAAIHEAVKAKDPEAASRAALAHVRRGGEWVIRRMHDEHLEL